MTNDYKEKDAEFEKELIKKVEELPLTDDCDSFIDGSDWARDYTLKELVKCHSGHEAHRALWYCPVCTERKIKELEKCLNEKYMVKKYEVAFDKKILSYTDKIKEQQQRIEELESSLLVLHRDVFRWTLNGEVLSNCYDSFSMEHVLKEKKLLLDTRYNDDIALVRLTSGKNKEAK